MAKKTLIVDDLTGESGARTRRLGLDGVEYEIDLTDTNYAELKAVLKPYLRAARQTGSAPSAGRRPSARTKSRTSSSRRSASTSDAAAVRAWARGQGLAVTERGRVTAELRSAWQAAGSPR